MADRHPLINSPSDESNTANNTPALPLLGFTTQSHSLGFAAHPNVSPPSSPHKFSRPGYQRLQSDATTTERNTPSTVLEEDEEDIADSFRSHSMGGLGIANTTSPAGSGRRVSIQTIPRVPIGAKTPGGQSPGILSTPNTGDPLMGGFPQDFAGSTPDFAGSTPDLRSARQSPREHVGDHEEFRRGVLKHGEQNQTNLRSVDDYQQYLHSSDRERLRKGPVSIRSAYENDFRPNQECPTNRDFYISRFSWISVTIVIICLFSTVFSGIFLGLAIKAPRFGRSITSQGRFKPSDAIVLTTVMAKLVELSFVTSFVAFLGQVLSRRAFMKEQGRGVTLSELSMWRWVVQPGTLITHWETAKYAGVTVLGILSLLSAVLATLYSTAATAVVQPSLKLGKWEHTVLAGNVMAEFANMKHIKKICESPIRTDAVDGEATCVQIEHAGQGYHNYQRYLSYWNTVVIYQNGSTDQRERPQAFGLLHENTTITGSWVNIINTTEMSKKYGRAINNVSLAMPHSGVFQAARDQRNGILQPEELNSEGSYFLRASVPSPVMNVLCANMNKDELEPIVYDRWGNGETVNGTTWAQLKNNATTTNTTEVDDLFGWTKKDPNKQDYPPVFARLPAPFNTILNHTNYGWGRDAIYFLGQGGNDGGSDLTGIYTLCKIYLTLTSHCSTHYNVTGSGGTMRAHCEDPEDDMAYRTSYSNASEVAKVPNWRDVGFDWANSLSLNTGIDDGNASNSRLLTQLILKPSAEKGGIVELNKQLPSTAEALAVLSGCTLLKSMQDAPFVDYWNETIPAIEQPKTQYFRAALKAQQYASGGPDHASQAWIVILGLVFLMNIFVLIYFLIHRGLVTDFSEPPNLFALAVNSPPSHLLAGSCGGGPEGKQYLVNWFVNTEGDHLYMLPGEKPSLAGHVHVHPHSHQHQHQHPTKMNSFFSAIAGRFKKSRKRGLQMNSNESQTRLRSASVVEGDFEMEDGSTKTQRQFAKLAKRRSML